MWRRSVIGWLFSGIIGVGLVACGGAPATPTPLPALVKPEQPAPVYPTGSAFRLDHPTVTPQVVVTQSPPDPNLSVGAVATPTAPARPLDLALLQPPPTALGIVRNGAALLSTPNGSVIERLPAGATLTLTGKSSDGGWLAAYSASGASGWVAANTLVLLGAESLETVTAPIGPGPIATLLTEAMAPMAMPTIVLTNTMTP